MKKSFLLIAAGLFAGFANGQEAHKSIVFHQGAASMSQPVVAPAPRSFDNLLAASHAIAGKTTTAGGSRWYNYGGDYQYNNVLGGDYTSGGSAGVTAPYMWFDTSSQDIYSGPTLAYNNLVSISEVLDPYFWGWDDPAVYSGEISVPPGYGFTVDSLEVIGVYERNEATEGAGIVDTLRVTYTSGAGNSTSNVGDEGWEGTGTTDFPFVPYATDTLLYLQTYHDSLHNIMTNVDPTGTTLGLPVGVYNILLHSTDTSGSYDYAFALPTPLIVAANNFPAMAITFISGDANAPHMPVGSTHYGDTVYTGDATSSNRYGMFRPLVVYNSDGSGNPLFMPWTLGTTVAGFTETNDLNIGLFKTEVSPSWGGLYLPSWAFNGGSPTTAGSYQYPAWGSMHIVCPTCPYSESLSTPGLAVTSSLNAYPNPASSQLNVTYSLAHNVAATVTLTNLLGQVVATQDGANGRAVFNTSNLPDGMYFYTLKANGDQATNHVVIAH